MPVISTVILVAIATYFLRNTVTGRQIYAVGSNIEASRLSGVKVERVQLFVYGLAGIMSAYAGILNAGLLATSATNAGSGTELDVVAAVIIGGASLSGGSGTIYGAVLGACIMALLRNAFVLLHLPAFIQTITIGVVLILAVASDGLRVGKSPSLIFTCGLCVPIRARWVPERSNREKEDSDESIPNRFYWYRPDSDYRFCICRRPERNDCQKGTSPRPCLRKRGKPRR